MQKCLYLAIIIGIILLNETIAEVRLFTGSCDASATATIDSKHFVVGDDEINILSIYNADSPGSPVYQLDLSNYFIKTLGQKVKKKAKKNPAKAFKIPKFPEIDIEGGARIGNKIFWIASHGLKKDGTHAPSRFVLFATQINIAGHISLTPIATPYILLLEDLFEDPRYIAFNLEAAAKIPPNKPGGINIEGLTNNSAGELLIGLRSPLFDGKALIVRLKNPEQVINGSKSIFGEPEFIDLGSAGIRGMASWQDRFFYVTTASAGEEPRLYHRKNNITDLQTILLPRGIDFNPESLVVLPDNTGGKIIVISDDGERLLTNGIRCKDLKQNSQKQFRAVEIRPDNILMPMCKDSSFEC